MTRPPDTLNQRVKQAYYYLDYLRLHRLGRKLKFFPKNRMMMDPEVADDPKKGYKAYIHRMYQTFIKHDFNYISNMKPRNDFGYNFGPKDDAIERSSISTHRAIDMFKDSEGMLLYLFRRHLMYKENTPLINAYLATYTGAKYVRPRAMSMFFNVRFGDHKPGAYDALKEMYKVRDAHLAIINTFNAEEHIKASVASVLGQIVKVNARQKAFLIGSQGEINAAREDIIDRVDVNQDSNGYVTGVDVRIRGGRMPRARIIPVYDGSTTVLEEVRFAKETTEAFLTYLIGQMRTATGLDINQIYMLSRSFYAPTLSQQARVIIENLSFEDVERQVRERMATEGVQEQRYRDYDEVMADVEIDEDGNPVVRAPRGFAQAQAVPMEEMEMRRIRERLIREVTEERVFQRQAAARVVDDTERSIMTELETAMLGQDRDAATMLRRQLIRHRQLMDE